ncbi:MAG: 50S ribosomal protein L15 [Desulfatitalea sp.]|nr:50S ribosomal protein L15 [Desulfatitalea sp.]NNK00225.1 50S ribosomal protein L15 [Desulfatitalea sp.]
MKLHELKPAAGATKDRKRKGRGVASGWGKTAGRGNKGQKQRSGGGIRPGWEGGQMPLHRRLPKRGFTNIFRKQFAVVNVKDLERFEAGSTVDPEALTDTGLVNGRHDGIKLLGQGEIGVALTIKLNAVSRSAKEKVEAAGGSVEVI